MSLKIKKGNTFILEVPIYDRNGALVTTLAAATTIKFQLKASQEGTAIVEKTVGAGIVVDQPETGYVQITLDPADTAQTPKKYIFGIEPVWTGAVYEVFTKIDGSWDDEIEIVQDNVTT